MKNRAPALASFAIFALLSGAALSDAAVAADLAVVNVDNTSYGQAVLTQRLNECYALVPTHVIGENCGVVPCFAELSGAGAMTPLGEGDFLRKLGFDLSIMRVTGALKQQCDEPFSCAGDTRDPASVAREGTTAALSYVRREDGSIARLPVLIRDVDMDYIRVTPFPGPERDALFQGLSGSLVSIDNRPIGLLMSVKDGVGSVLRFYRVMELARPFFCDYRKPAGETPSPPSRDQFDAALIDNGGKVVSWSVPALSPEHRASNLIDNDETAPTVWLTRELRFPVKIVIDLAGDEAVRVSRLELDGAAVEPADSLPRDFEILVSRSVVRERWISIKSGTYFPRDLKKSVNLPPMRAKRVMLRFRSNWGHNSSVGLRSVKVFADR